LDQRPYAGVLRVYRQSSEHPVYAPDSWAVQTGAPRGNTIYVLLGGAPIVFLDLFRSLHSLRHDPLSLSFRQTLHRFMWPLVLDLFR